MAFTRIRPGTLSWRGHIFLERGWLLYDGPVAPTATHSHHAFQIILRSEPPVQLASEGQLLTVDVAMVPADAPHAFASTAPRLAVIYIAPESRMGRHLASLLGTTHDVLAWANAAAPLRGLATTRIESWENARRMFDLVMATLLGVDSRARPWPPAIQQLVTMLPQRLDEELRLGRLATELGLSEGRLSHLITEYLGIPFRPYVLWLRLERAATEVARGRTLTEAAHHAGFSDGAHLSRVFKRMFGISPSELAAVAQWHVAP